MEMALEGVRVLDFSRYGAGPYGGMILADMGAEVVRVVFHNFTVGAEEARLLSYDSLKEVNPAIIVASITGFGTTGPYAGRTAFDSVAQALSGAMSYTGFPGGPPTRAAVPYVDFGTGTYAALSIVLALYHRQKTGKGQRIDVSMIDTAVSYVASIGCAAEYKLLNYVRPQIGNHSFYNFTDLFKTKDGWIMISIIGTPLWKRLTRAIGREDWGEDPRFKDDMDRFENRHLFEPTISEWIAERTTQEVMRILEEARVPYGQVNNIAEIVEDPHVKAQELLVDVKYPGVGEVPLPGAMPKFSETPGRIQRRAPLVGEHNSEIYCDLLGLTSEELSQLEAEGVI